MKEKNYKKLKNFIHISRYNKPHGFLLLYYPCLWGLFLNNNNITDVFFLCIVFLLGSCGMRSLGCIWNDFNDREIDKKVLRTKNRLIASGKIKYYEVFIYAIINILIGIIPIFYIPFKAVIIALLVLPLVIIYPFMKRITWWPQLWLGLNFNWGVLVGYTTISNEYFSVNIFIFYLGCVFWTIAYDTVYGFQDILDDEVIGVKSTSIKFKNKPKTFIAICYFICLILFNISLFFIFNSYFLNLFLLIPFLFISYKLFSLNHKNIYSCASFFKANSFFGIIITIILVIFSNL